MADGRPPLRVGLVSSTVQSNVETAPREGTRQAVFRDIVCGVDGSRGSYLAAHQAVALSGDDGEVRFVAVHYTEGVGLNEMSTLSEHRAAEALAQAERLAESSGSHASLGPVSAPRATAALRSEAAGHDLLVIGSHGGSRAGGIMLGSVVTQIVHRCERPLLIARRVVDHGDFPETVLFATDGSAGSWPAARVAARIAALRDAEVHVVHVPDGGGSKADTQVHEQLLLISSAMGRPSGFQDKPGAAPERICQAARACQSSLVVMGRRGVGGIKALGSVSERVAHRASCSVLLVPSEPAAR
jgi:nucleotide-binding universal stress UspA family protein